MRQRASGETFLRPARLAAFAQRFARPLQAHFSWLRKQLAFSPRTTLSTFFACLAAYWCQWTIGINTVGTDATLSKFQQTTGYFCNLDSPTNMLGYILMAVIGGIMGAIFNYIVETLNHFRAHHIHKSAVSAC